MPLKNPKPIGLKKLKKIVGHKGESFARFVGVPYDTLKPIESGRSKMSKAVAHKIKAATGVLEESLYKSKLRPLIARCAGEEYTAEHFHHWRVRYLGIGENKADARRRAVESARNLAFFAKVLMMAAADDGRKVTHAAIHIEIASVIRLMAERFELGPAIEKVLREFPIEDTSEPYTKVEWMSESKEIRDHYGVTDKELRRVPDFQPYPKTTTLYPRWVPEGGVDEQALNKI